MTSFGALCTALSATIEPEILPGSDCDCGRRTGRTVLDGGGSIFPEWQRSMQKGFAIKYRTTTKKGMFLADRSIILKTEWEKTGAGWQKYLHFSEPESGCLNRYVYPGNSIASAVKNFFDPNTENAVQMFGNTYSWATVITCIILTVCVGLVVIGGLKRIAKVSEIVVPFMAVLYVVFVLIIMITHITEIPAAIVTIVKSAFTGSALAGGADGNRGRGQYERDRKGNLFPMRRVLVVRRSRQRLQ